MLIRLDLCKKIVIMWTESCLRTCDTFKRGSGYEKKRVGNREKRGNSNKLEIGSRREGNESGCWKGASVLTQCSKVWEVIVVSGQSESVGRKKGQSVKRCRK